MTCWGATTECLKNCCGGPHSEHYDSWLARERLRQLNAQTIRVDQLTRENVVLGQALNQSQDILASYRDLDQYDTGSQPESRPSNPPGYPPPRPNYTSPTNAAPPGLSRRGDSASVELPPVVQSIRRDDLRPTSPARQWPSMSEPRGGLPQRLSGVSLSPPSLNAAASGSTPRMASPVRPMDPVAPAVPVLRQQPPPAPPPVVPMPPLPLATQAPPPSAMAAAERRVIMERLMAPLPQITARATVEATPFAAEEQQQTGGHPRTHGYAPRGRA